MSGDSLTTKTVSGLSWEMGSGVLKRVLRFVISVVLARLLLPEHFGLFAMVLIVFGFMELFLDMGLDTALVQRKSLREAHRSSAFWAQGFLALVLSGLFLGAAPFVAGFFGEPELVPLMYVFAVNFVLAASYAVPASLVRRRMEFRIRGVIEVLAVIVAGIVSVVMAVRGWGVWSLAVNLIGLNLVEAVGYWSITNWRPRFRFSVRALGDLLKVGMGLTGYLVMDYWVRKTDDLLIGKLVGDVSLGLYTRAYSLMRLPTRQATALAGNVLVSSMSKIQEDTERIRELFLRGNRLIAFCTLPLMAGLVLTARPFVITVFGRHWLGTVPFLRVLAVAGLANPLAASSSWIFRSQGETELQFRWGLVYGAMMVSGFLVGVQWGAYGVAVAYTLVIYLSWLPFVALAGTLIDLGIATYLYNLRGVAFATGAMSLAVALARRAVSTLSPYSQCFLLVSLGGAVYFLLAHLLDLRAYTELRRFLGRGLSTESVEHESS